MIEKHFVILHGSLQGKDNFISMTPILFIVSLTNIFLKIISDVIDVVVTVLLAGIVGFFNIQHLLV